MVFVKHGEVVGLQGLGSVSKHCCSYSKFRHGKSSVISWRCGRLQGCRLFPHFSRSWGSRQTAGVDDLFLRCSFLHGTFDKRLTGVRWHALYLYSPNVLCPIPQFIRLSGCYTEMYQSMPQSGQSLMIDSCHLFFVISSLISCSHTKGPYEMDPWIFHQYRHRQGKVHTGPLYLTVNHYSYVCLHWTVCPTLPSQSCQTSCRLSYPHSVAASTLA